MIKFILLPLLLAGLSTAGAETPAPSSPSPRTPLQWSTLAADSEMARLGDTLCAPPLGKRKWDHTTGIYADALMRLSAKTGLPAYGASAEKTVGSFITPEGTIATLKIKPADQTATPGKPQSGYYSLDDIQLGVVLFELHDSTGEERYLKAAGFLRDRLRQYPRTPEGGFWHSDRLTNQMWIDGLYMAQPFYAAYAKRFNEPADFDDITNQFRLVTQHAYDPKTGLLYQGWDESKSMPWADKETGLSPSFWSRAIGWYMMALVDALDDMPANSPQRAELTGYFQQAAQGILKYQDAQTGVWWEVTDQGARADNYLEATASSMFVYALAKGINRGYLPVSETPAVHAAYQGLIRQFVRVSPDDKTMDLIRCCSAGGLDKKRLGTYAYYTKGEKIVSNDLKGIGPFINAGIECSQLFGADTFSP